MRRFIALCAAALVAALMALAFLPLSVAPETVRQAVIDRLTALTGHEVEIAGETELRRFPYLRFAVNDIRLHRDHHLDGELARIDRLTGSVSLLPLFVGRIEAASLTLIRPRLSLAVDRLGRSNWAAGEGEAVLAMTQPDAYPAGEVQIGDVRVQDGSIRYLDRRSGEVIEVEAVNGTLSWPSLAAPLAGTGSLVWRDDPVEFNFFAKEPFSFLRRGSSTTRLSLSSPFVSVSFSGNAHLTDNPHVQGRLALSADSTRRLLRRLGTDFGSGAGLDALELSGKISVLGNTAIISGLKLRLDGNAAEGSLKVDLEQDRIGLQGTLAFETLDLNAYRSVDLPGDLALPSNATARPIDLSDLRRVEADLRISADHLVFGELALGKTAGTATVRDGALTLGLAQSAIYGGAGLGTISLSPHASGVRTRVNATWERITVSDFLKSAGLQPRFAGTASGWAKLSGHGATLADILADLSGEASVVVTEGTLIGIDVPRLVETAASRRLLAGWAAGERARTSFDRLNAKLHVVDGVATTSDLRLVGPDLDITLSADIRLAAASLAGRGDAKLSRGERAGDALPFTINGPIAAPRLRVDREWLIESARTSVTSGDGAGGIVADELFGRVLDRLPALSQ